MIVAEFHLTMPNDTDNSTGLECDDEPLRMNMIVLPIERMAAAIAFVNRRFAPSLTVAIDWRKNQLYANSCNR